MPSFLKLVNLIYIPLAALAHLLIKIYLVDAFAWPSGSIWLMDLMMVFAFTARLGKRQIPRFPFLRSLIKISLLCFSFFSFYIPTLLILALLNLFTAVTPVICFSALTFSIGMTLYQAWKVQHPQLRNIQVPIADKFHDLKGLVFIHISDLHLGPFLDASFVANTVEKILQTPSEFVCLTGDLMDGPFQAYADCIEPLQRLVDKKPVYFVTGNHEYYYDASMWIQKLQAMGVHVLRSELQKFSWKNTSLTIAGIDDNLFQNPQEESFKKHLADSKAPCLLLSHRPEAWDHYKQYPVLLQLSGHGHGGQAFPWAIIIRKVMKYPMGLFQDQGSSLYVHRGTGFWGPPNRWLNPPEICRIEFV